MTKSTRILNRMDLCKILHDNPETVLEVSWVDSAKEGYQGMYVNQTYRAKWHKPRKEGTFKAIAVRVKQGLHGWYTSQLPWITDRFTVVLVA